MAWVLLVYLIIAALHGLVPKLWARHYIDRQDNGPFRVLLFTPLIVTGLVVFLFRGLSPRFFSLPHVACPVNRTLWPAWSLRGPPSCREFSD